MRRLAIACVGLVGAILVVEVALRAAGVGARRGPGDPFRIACIGDSYVAGSGGERDDAWPAQLERELSKRPGPRTEVVNLGIPGANSAQILQLLPVFLEVYEPDLALVLVGTNDGWNGAKPDREREEAWGGDETERGGDAAGGWLARAWRASAIASLASDPAGRAPLPADPPRLASWPRTRPGSPPGTTWQFLHGRVRATLFHEDREPVLPEAEHAALLRANLDAMVDVARAAGVPLVVLEYPNADRRFGLASRIARETTGAPTIPLSLRSELIGHLGLAPGQFGHVRLFTEDHHPTARLHAAYAEALAEALAERGLLPGSAPAPTGSRPSVR